MRALVFHFSSLVGLLVLINQLWNAAEIERTIVLAFTAGLSMYTILMVGFAVAQRIMTTAPAGGHAAEAAPGTDVVPSTPHDEPAPDQTEQPAAST